MRIKLGRLRALVAGALWEAGGGWSSPPQPAGRSAFSADIVNREQIGRMESGTQDVEKLADHLEEPAVDFKDTYGPVPPDEPEPYVGQDPYVRDASPLPSPGIRRG